MKCGVLWLLDQKPRDAIAGQSGRVLHVRVSFVNFVPKSRSSPLPVHAHVISHVMTAHLQHLSSKFHICMSRDSV